jgi:predicted TIM-barrel fold metal-dependent hydrolase
VLGQITDYIPNPTFDVVARPEGVGAVLPGGQSRGEVAAGAVRGADACDPGVPGAGPRLEVMDGLGIDRTLMFPTLASLVEERMRDHPELIHAGVHSLNQWIFETWGFNHKDRIYTTPVISPPILDKAIAELEWCLEPGARAILVRPAPLPGYGGSRSFAMLEFDPFWKRVEAAGVLVAMHSSDSGYARYSQDWEGSQIEMTPFKADTFRMVAEWRPVTDAVASWVCHGALYRFPQLKVAVIENGSSWVQPLLDTLATIYKKQPQAFPTDPVEEIRTRIHISPFWEDDMAAVADMVGVDRVLLGSDYPHPEGLSDPVTYVDALGKMAAEDQAKIMGGNLARLIDG